MMFQRLSRWIDFRGFAGDRRGATAVIIALMMVPMIMSAGAAVDFSRVASARAQLQAAVDAASIAGVGAYQTNQQGTSAYNVASSTFKLSTASVTSYATITSSTIGTGCSGSTSQCGSTSTSATYIKCPQDDYCVQVNAQATLKNSLLAAWIPTDILNVSATADTQTVLGAQNFSGTDVANAYDNNSIYAYPVPLSSAGTPEYNSLPYPSSSCTGPITNGVLASELANSNTSASTACQYYQIGDSTGAVTTPQTPIAVGGTQPIAFLFVNITGNTTGYGFSPVGTSTGAVGTPQSGAGFCPIWNLYGSMSQESSIVPVQDSTHIYTSAYEMYGLPPTYSSNNADEASAADPSGINQPFGTNRPIVPFTVPAGTNVGTQNIITAVSQNGTKTVTQENNYLTTQPFQCPTQSSWTASYYPSNPYYNRTSGVTGPLVVGGCTPNTSSTPWNYSGSNLGTGDCDPGEYNTSQQTTGVTPAVQASNFSNCALIIEPLGTGVTKLPSSFTVNTATPETWTDPASGRVTDFTATTLVASAAANGVGTDFPPESTAHRCNDPAAGYNSTQDQFSYTLAEAEAYDYIENPGLGGITCNSPTPSSYGLYWNDMGSEKVDDLGYWNAITLFTCSVPGGGGGPAVLSG